MHSKGRNQFITKLRKPALLLASVFLFFSISGLAAASPVGTWKTIDDETGKAKSYVKITEYKGSLWGQIQKLLNRGPDEDPDPVCDKCTGRNKGKKVVGLWIMWNLKDEDGDGKYDGGYIMDPKNGKTYKCHIKLKDANTLEVRGYIGFSLIGRTQTWYRVN